MNLSGYNELLAIWTSVGTYMHLYYLPGHVSYLLFGCYSERTLKISIVGHNPL